MSLQEQKFAPRVALVLATVEDSQVLGNLLELYVHDFSEFLYLEIGDDGRFGFASLESYWTEPGRHVLLVKADGKLAGFAMVAAEADAAHGHTVWDVAQFFILRRWRRKGVGTRAAHAVWRQFPGRWKVRVMEANRPALDFWSEAVSAFAGETIEPTLVEKDGERHRVFMFKSDPG